MAGISNAMEILEFSEALLLDLSEAQSDDGKISVFEVAKVALENAPGAFAAASGADELKLELADLSSDEIKQLAEKAFSVGKAALKLAGKG